MSKFGVSAILVGILTICITEFAVNFSRANNGENLNFLGSIFLPLGIGFIILGIVVLIIQATRKG